MCSVLVFVRKRVKSFARQIKVTLKLIKTQTNNKKKQTNRSESAGADFVVFLCFAGVSGLFSSLQLLVFVLLARLPSDSHAWRGQPDCKLCVVYVVETAAFALIPLQSTKLQVEAGNKRNKQKLLVWNLKPCFSETCVFTRGRYIWARVGHALPLLAVPDVYGASLWKKD